MRHHFGHATAFAEGRRLREAARTRRQTSRRWPPPPGSGPSWGAPAQPWVRHRAWSHSCVVVLLVLLAIPILSGVIGTVLLAVLAAGVLATVALSAAAPALLVGTAAFVAVRRRRGRAASRRGAAAGTAPLPARPAAPPRPDLGWALARSRFHALRAEYAAFECDAMQVLRLPALADVSVPSTGRFVDAFAEAQALETDLFPPGPHAAGFVAAVDRAERAWRAAREAAERIRLSGLSATERSTVERVIKLLTTARDSGNDPERLAAYTRARSELAKLDRAGVIQLPRPAKSALDTAAQGALPGGGESQTLSR